jgi:ATP-dependent Lhr-like helicase
MSVEAVAGGFGSVYRVLRMMEEAARVRRGYFVEGLGGAQFAYPGVVDRLRRVREASGEAQAVLMAATDPANPYGWLLPWPEFGLAGGRPPQRAVGARVVLVDGEAVLYVHRGGRKVRVRADADEELLDRALAVLEPMARRRRRRELQVETIDEDAALESRWRAAFQRAGFRASYKALRLTASDAGG